MKATPTNNDKKVIPLFPDESQSIHDEIRQFVLEESPKKLKKK